MLDESGNAAGSSDDDGYRHVLEEREDQDRELAELLDGDSKEGAESEKSDSNDPIPDITHDSLGSITISDKESSIQQESTPSTLKVHSEKIPARLSSLTINTTLDSDLSLQDKLYLSLLSGSRPVLLKLFTCVESPSKLSSVLLTAAWSNRDRLFHFDPEIEPDATSLLGPSLENINAVHLASFLGLEDLALDVLEFLDKQSLIWNSKVILMAFLGQTWGNGNTALHLSSFLGWRRLTERLLQMGASPGRKNERGLRAVDVCDDEETRRLFWRAGTSNASRRDSAATIRKSISLDRLPIRPYRPPSMLKYVSAPDVSLDETSVSICEARLDSGASTSISPVLAKAVPCLPAKTKKKKGNVRFNDRALILEYAKNGDAELFNCDKDLILNSVTSARELSCLHLVSSYNHLALLKPLLSLGMDINSLDIEGWTPLHCASAEGHVEMVREICAVDGIKLDVRNGDGESVWEVCEDDEEGDGVRNEIEDIIARAWDRVYNSSDPNAQTPDPSLSPPQHKQTRDSSTMSHLNLNVTMSDPSMNVSMGMREIESKEEGETIKPTEPVVPVPRLLLEPQVTSSAPELSPIASATSLQHDEVAVVQPQENTTIPILPKTNSLVESPMMSAKPPEPISSPKSQVARNVRPASVGSPPRAAESKSAAPAEPLSPNPKPFSPERSTLQRTNSTPDSNAPSLIRRLSCQDLSITSTTVVTCPPSSLSKPAGSGSPISPLISRALPRRTASPLQTQVPPAQDQAEGPPVSKNFAKYLSRYETLEQATPRSATGDPMRSRSASSTAGLSRRPKTSSMKLTMADKREDRPGGMVAATATSEGRVFRSVANAAAILSRWNKSTKPESPSSSPPVSPRPKDRKEKKKKSSSGSSSPKRDGPNYTTTRLDKETNLKQNRVKEIALQLQQSSSSPTGTPKTRPRSPTLGSAPSIFTTPGALGRRRPAIRIHSAGSSPSFGSSSPKRSASPKSSRNASFASPLSAPTTTTSFHAPRTLSNTMLYLSDSNIVKARLNKLLVAEEQSPRRRSGVTSSKVSLVGGRSKSLAKGDRVLIDSGPRSPRR